MKVTNRLFALLLAVVMMIGVLPAGVFAEGTEEELHYLLFASDLHSSVSGGKVSATLDKSKFSFGNTPEYAAMIGDMAGTGGSDAPAYSTSSVADVVHQIAPGAEVDIIYGSHDANANDDANIMNCKATGSSGLVYTGKNGDGTTAYYVYGIAYNDMTSSGNSAAVNAFTTWANGVTDKSIPIFICSHVPLHDRRNDNPGAANWLTAINAASVDRNVVFFWGHNHTGETTADTDAYYVAPGGSITPEGGSKTTINFTYMNAGYLSAKTAATLVKLGEKTITLSKYTNGSVSDKTITRVAKSAPDDDEDDGDSADGRVPGTMEITVPGKKTVYKLVSSPSAGNNYVIVNLNSAGTGHALGNSGTNNAAPSDVTVTVKAKDTLVDAPYIETVDGSAVWAVSSGLVLKNGSQYLAYNSSNPRVRTRTSSTKWTYSSNKLQSTYYLRYNSGWTGTSSSSYGTRVYFYEETEIDTTVTNKLEGVYSVAADSAEFIVESGRSTAKELALNPKVLFTPKGEDPIDVEIEDYVLSLYGTSSIGTLSGDTFTFNGSEGTAYVKVTSKEGFGADGAAPFTIVEIKAMNPGYEAVIIPETDEISNGVITRKGIRQGDVIMLGSELWYVAEDGKTKVEGKAVSWKSSDPSVATVDEGKVSLTGKDGLVRIEVSYEISEGEYETDYVTLSVSTKNYITPADGTGDFPEYPNEGSIRFDKNAQAVGNFSRTGITQIELSMTGVPYTTHKPIDVILVLDLTSSMTTTRLNALREATLTFIDSIAFNEDGSFSQNRIAITTFNVNGSTTRQQMGALDQTTYKDLTDLISANIKEGTKWQASGGTPWNAALQAANGILDDTRESDRKQYLVFMTDGGPTAYTPVKTNVTGGAEPEMGTALTAGSTTDTSYFITAKNQTQSWYGASSPYSRTAYYRQEYYSTLMESKGVTIYSVGVGLDEVIRGSGWGTTGSTPTADNDRYHAMANDLVDDIKSENGASYFVATGAGAPDPTAELTAIFKNIASDIVEAATDVVVSDKIADEYTLVLDAPNELVRVNLPDDFEGFRVEFVEYQLDKNHERTTSRVIETVRLGDGKVTEYEKGNGEKLYSINADNFQYDAETRMLTWGTLDKITNTEYALRYYLYLDNSQGHVSEDNEAPAGTYPTNDWATLSYTNFDGSECQQEYPIPQMTWNGAQVSYVFYLVNSEGKPVNKAGQVVDFANASFVTEVSTASVVWNSDSDVTSLVNAYIASAIVPEEYTLYDIKAAYEINVFAEADGTVKKNQFIISGGPDVTNKTTTKVYNTKAGTKYSAYGTYTAADANGFDFANTTVAFAVVWEPRLNPDVIVVDYGIPIDIDVCANDLFDNVPHGISLTKPSAAIDTGVSTTAFFKDSVLELKNGKLEKNGSGLRFTPDSMIFASPMTVYYDTEVTYYEDGTKHTGYLYSSLTIVPATIIYYEDDFVDFGDEWSSVGTVDDKTQAQDRPGTSEISALLDGDNVYGFDPAYTTGTTFSLGHAMKATASASDTAAPTATFTFRGTGFDIISMTDTTTGTIIVDVADESGKTVRSLIVDTYYGCKCVPHYYKRAYTYSAGNWHPGEITEDSRENYDLHKGDTLPEAPASGTVKYLYEIGYEWVNSGASYDTLYQIPVINCRDLTYGTYDVTVRMFYHPMFRHTAEDSYDFYLDAIRIYDPAKGSDEAESAYAEDHESFPVFTEVRDILIDSEAFGDGTSVKGAVFIDGFAGIADGGEDAMFRYTNFGPNNEVYLAEGQAIAFTLTGGAGLDRVHIGAKSVTGSAVLDVNGTKTGISTATELYYDVTDSIGADGTVVIRNGGEGILSITYLKVTYTGSADEPAMAFVNRETAYLAAAAVREAYIASKTVAFAPKLNVYTNGKTARIGDAIRVTVTAPADVTSISVNGIEATEEKTNAMTGRVTWTATLTADSEETFTVSVVAGNDDGCRSTANETELKTVGKDAALPLKSCAVTVSPAAMLESIFG
ncbi:MAG: VWA domain-containing protein [Lachnospiraceae bacterium]|nr:VWA domain-containing protein [Lachnospiraceae bacterium]